MKMKAPLAIAFIILTIWIYPSYAGELKVATVDLQAVLKQYDKANEALKTVQLQEVSFAKELDGLKLEGQKLVREAEELGKSITDLALSAAERDLRRKRWEDKLQGLSALRIRYDELREEKQRELRLSLERSNRQVLEEIVTVTRKIGDEEGFNLILNRNRDNPTAGEVVFAKGVTDITEKVVTTLNQRKK